jgi:hypothetical protein
VLTAVEVLQLIAENPDIEMELTDDQCLEMELTVMDLLACKAAGGEHMVIWESGELH